MDKLKLYYVDIKNMGDQLNPMIVRDVFGYESERSSYLTGELSAIGSGLDQFMLHGSVTDRLRQRVYGARHPLVYVWGTGFINAPAGDTAFYRKAMRFCAVRGELSKRRVEALLGRRLYIPTGDGGLLANELIPEQIEKKYDLGIVPHVCDLGESAMAELRQRYGSLAVIDVREEPYSVLRRIAECRTILSSSLHGLVVADSFGIPNRHIVISDKPKGDGFKYDDYYSAYGVEHRFTDLRQSDACTPEEIEKSYLITPDMVAEKREQLRAAFPFPARERGRA